MKLNKYVYDGHMENIYFLDEYDETQEEECELCGECDRCIGFMETTEELEKYLKDRRYSSEYIQEVLKEVSDVRN
ncbi:hypothetical protein [Streptococcus agalactiae]|uniref:hypothetical protein n=1 Tax=Streptococcus agalactiae TaxID=1311 RepID=UPI0024BBCDD2|nr:hypothetical protein [Streptococcus agalactiae]